MGVQVVDKLAGGSPCTPSCLGGHLCLPHWGVHGLRKLGAQWMISFPPDADLVAALLVTFSFPGPGTRPPGVVGFPITKQSGAAIPGGGPPLGDWISLSEWKIFRGYYFPKGWAPPTLISMSASLNAIQYPGEDHSETKSGVRRLALIPVSLEPIIEIVSHSKEKTKGQATNVSSE